MSSHSKKPSNLPTYTEEQVEKSLTAAKSRKDLYQIRANCIARGVFTDRATNAFMTRAIKLARDEISQRTGLSFDNLGPCESAIAEIACEVVAWIYMEGGNPAGTLAQLRWRKWKGSVIACVEGDPTTVCEIAKVQGKLHLAYEQIVIAYEDDFTPRTLWFARRNLGLPNESAKPPRRSGRA